MEAVFSENQLTPAMAMEELKALAKEMGALKASVDALVTGFTGLSVPRMDLEPGACELGVLIPRAAVQDRLDLFATELKIFHQVLKDMNEYVTNDAAPVRIRAISSSDLTVYLDMLPKVGAFLAVCLERLIAAYKKILEIRKLRNELATQGVPEESLGQVDSHANTVMEEEIRSIVEEVCRENCAVEGARKNELEVSLQTGLNRLANRIDKGYNIDIRAKPPEQAANDNSDDAERAAADAALVISQASAALEFIREEGAPILTLPEGEEEGKKKSGS